ncbi:MAG: ABC transporter substrate-binding protein, partial [Candidatus Dormibacteraceae bacterium]
MNLDPAKSPVFQDVRVRQALYWALDREAIVKTIYFGFATVANGPIPPTLKQYYDGNVKPLYTHDPKKAGQLLDEAGWKTGSTGVRAKDGQELSFPVMVPSSDQVEINMAQAIQAQWG